MAVSRRLRYEILRRDNNTCQYCGQAAPDVKLTVDHVVPIALGGGDEPSNLVAACADCNAGKSASSPDSALVAAVDEKAMQWSGAMAAAAEQRMAAVAADLARTDPFDKEWRSWTLDGKSAPRDANWANSIRRFFAAGLTDLFLTDAVRTSMGLERVPAEDKWRYFCGICWREIDNITKSAIVLVGEPAAALAEPVPARRDFFEYMVMFDAFLDDLVPALGGNEDDLREAGRLLWDAMPEAHQVWRESLDLPRPDNLDDDEDDITATDLACEHFSNVIANGMYHLGISRKGRTDGS